MVCTFKLAGAIGFGRVITSQVCLQIYTPPSTLRLILKGVNRTKKRNQRLWYLYFQGDPTEKELNNERVLQVDDFPPPGKPVLTNQAKTCWFSARNQ